MTEELATTAAKLIFQGTLKAIGWTVGIFISEEIGKAITDAADNIDND
ncbi:MAG: hypothetical protein L3V56_14310 [Candidatus Magnetoovum sp. WYHC-5]|nr:hypothetical protein [Candidatus Magnetoovum sp. WYHC-5]